jgi:hypothetical protein
MPIILKSGSLNFLEPYRAVQDCNDIALPFSAFTRIVVAVAVQTWYGPEGSQEVRAPRFPKLRQI